MKHFLRHLLFPRESNNHRPKLLHHDSLFFVIALFVFFGSIFTSVHTNYPQVLGISANISAQDLLTFTNQKRQEHGLQPLNMNNQLAQAAEQKASHMFAQDYWAHIAPDGTTPWYFIKNSGYEYLYAGENLARGFNSASDVVNAWMDSPSHRDNMLSKNYTEIGFAIQTGMLTGSETILVVEMLGAAYVNQQEQASAQGAQVSPTPSVVIARISLTPTPSVLPSASPTLEPIPTQVPQESEQPSTVVAAVQNQPLVDKTSLTKTIAYALLFLFLAVLIADAIIIERRKIARVVAHNMDHIIFLTIILIIVIIIGKGLVL
jgi:uncharacterized protein YkwD